MIVRRTTALSVLMVAALAGTLLNGSPAQATPPVTKAPVAVGRGGAASTVDIDATRVAIDVLRHGGNAVDAAVAAAATLGVTEPFSSGLGGGGFLVFYNARTKTVHTIDGREAAPRGYGGGRLHQPRHRTAVRVPGGARQRHLGGRTGDAADLADRAAEVGHDLPARRAAPGDPGRRPGLRGRPDVRQPDQREPRGVLAVQLVQRAVSAGRGAARGRLDLPQPGSRPDLPPAQPAGRGRVLPGRAGRRHRTHGAAPAGRRGTARTVGVPDPPRRRCTASDLAGYDVRTPRPTHMRYRGFDVFGMPTPSSGGSTVGEGLNIVENWDLGDLSQTQALHRYLEASALAFADRNRYVGDDTPRALLDELLSQRFARERACLIDPAQALAKPVAPGVPDGSYDRCAVAAPALVLTDERGTTNLTVADRWGNVVEYTLTIEQTGGNAMVVPGRGFLLNNELTDFNFTPTQGDAADPNLPAPGKRPRSSMAPTILLSHGKPFLATGSPGGSMIITTVFQILVNRIDLGMTLPEAVAAPRASQRNTAAVQAEPAFLASPEAAELMALGHVFASTPEIGAATGVEFLPDGQVVAAAEPVRRGGGSAAVVKPSQ